jgi:hypothetical protein
VRGEANVDESLRLRRGIAGYVCVSVNFCVTPSREVGWRDTAVPASIDTPPSAKTMQRPIVIALLAALSAPVATVAQEMRDPMQPPAFLLPKAVRSAPARAETAPVVVPASAAHGTNIMVLKPDDVRSPKLVRSTPAQ